MSSDAVLRQQAPNPFANPARRIFVIEPLRAPAGVDASVLLAASRLFADLLTNALPGVTLLSRTAPDGPHFTVRASIDVWTPSVPARSRFASAEMTVAVLDDAGRWLDAVVLRSSDVAGPDELAGCVRQSALRFVDYLAARTR